MYFGFDELCLLPFHERKNIYSWPKVIYACKVFPWDLRQTGRAMRRYALVLSIPNAWLVGVAYPEPEFWNGFYAEISWKTKCNCRSQVWSHHYLILVVLADSSQPQYQRYALHEDFFSVISPIILLIQIQLIQLLVGSLIGKL